MKKQNTLTTLTLVMSFVVAACGEYKNDPLRNHNVPETLKTVDGPEDVQAPPPKVEVVIKEVPVQVDREVIKEVPVDRPVFYPTEERKNFAANQVFQITSEGSLSFVAGRESAARFTVRALQGEVDFSVKAVKLPPGSASLTLVKSQPNLQVVEFKYKPSLNIMDPSAQEFRPEEGSGIRLQMFVKSVKGKDEKTTQELIEVYNTISTVKEFPYVVRRDTRIPKVLDAVSFPKSIVEGDKASFSIRFEAPGTYEGFSPVVYAVPDYNAFVNNLYDNNGTVFIRPSMTRKPLEFVSEGVWIANFDLDTNLYPVPQQLDRQLKPVANAQSTWLRVAFYVKSPAGTQSENFVQRFQVVYKPKAEPVQAPVETTPPAKADESQQQPAQGGPRAPQLPSTPPAEPSGVPMPRPKPVNQSANGGDSMEQP